MKNSLSNLIVIVLLALPHSHAQDTERIRDVIYAKHDGVALTMDVFKPAKPNDCSC